MFKFIFTAVALACSITVTAAEIPIRGIVTSKCVINIDTPGVYGNPTPGLLSTLAVDGGVTPVIRYDVIEAGYYKATITAPNSFTSSPTLTDNVTWTGSKIGRAHV